MQERTLKLTSFRSRLLMGAAVLAVVLTLGHLQELLWLFPSYRNLYQLYSFYVPNGCVSLLQIVLVAVALALLCRESVRTATAELGFFAPPLQGFAFGFGAAAVMFIGFAATVPFKVPSDVLALLYLVGLSPLAEETLYRAFAVGTLRDRCGAPVWLALLLPAIIFGLGHVDQGAALSEKVALFALTASGGLIFGWFYLRWQRNLWIPFSIHAGMNLSWELFDVSSNALGGWWPFSLQIGAVVVGIVATLKFAPRRAVSTLVEAGA